ncbi:hypothetical protein LshimejAT787_0210580 [Lyophyllum shimeji]|uniref:F-box domain-containing protein n=1 Tax=Lyophyllum shimeji TaxID=47721 RepID=A0A9P3PHE4_LYOSH|nr:hypothetical protein LshimejAT787_0210580 [Lyophyllum shimeji]
METLTPPEHPPKRRRCDDSYPPGRPAAPVAVKPRRGRKGGLALLPDLPLDVLFEIFKHLRPLDLLRLARSWKRMRAFLMSRRSRWIWRQALSRLEGLPSCPPGMSEPQFTDLMFSSHCHYCGAEPVPTILWLTRNRACKVCFPKHFRQAKDILHDPRFSGLPAECWKFAEITGRIIHSTSFAPVTSRDTCRQIVNLELLEKLTNEYMVIAGHASRVERWLSETRRDHEAWARTAESLVSWLRQQAQKRSLELLAARQRRLDAVIRYLNAAGWTEDIRKMDLDLLRYHKLVNIPRDLTERVWVRIRPKLFDFMGRVASRLREEYRLDQVTRRRRIFSQYVMSCHPRDAILAPISELSQLEPFRAIIEDSPLDQVITLHSFPPSHVISQLFCRWQRHRKHNVVQIMRKSGLVPWNVSAAHINLATTFFYCSGPGFREPIGQQDILVHPAAFSWRPEREYSSGYLTRLFEDFQQEFWNFGGDRVFFHEPAFLAARSIVSACGYDPDRTTAAAMDKWSYLFECKSCRSSTTGRLVMTWRRAVIHAIDHLSFFPSPAPHWLVLDPGDTYYCAAVDQIVAEPYSGPTLAFADDHPDPAAPLSRPSALSFDFGCLLWQRSVWR